MKIERIDPSQNHQCDAIEQNLQCQNQANYHVNYSSYNYNFCDSHFLEFCHRFNIKSD